MINNNPWLTFFILIMMILVPGEYFILAQHQPAVESKQAIPTTVLTSGFNFNSGTRLSYYFEYDLTGVVDINKIHLHQPSKQINLTPVSISSQGELGLWFFAVNDQRWQVAAKIERFHYQLNDKKIDIEQFIHPFTFMISATGKLSRFEFSAQMSIQNQMYVKHLLQQFELELIDKAQSRWVVESGDLHGRYLSAYRITGYQQEQSLEKVKRQYLSHLQTEAWFGVSNTQVIVAHSKSRYGLGGVNDWIVGLEQKQNIDLVTEQQVWGWLQGHLKVEKQHQILASNFAYNLEEQCLTCFISLSPGVLAQVVY